MESCEFTILAANKKENVQFMDNPLNTHFFIFVDNLQHITYLQPNPPTHTRTRVHTHTRLLTHAEEEKTRRKKK